MSCVAKLYVAVVLLIVIGAILFATFLLPLIVDGPWWDETTTTTPMTPSTTPHQCGTKFIDGPNGHIVQGNPTTGIERWPWVVYFHTRPDDIDYLLCTGTLIAPRWVLTAAHCTQYSVDEEKARNASYQGRTTTGLVAVNVGEWGKRYATMKKVWRIHPHPDYLLIDFGNGTGVGTIHDLALLELKIPIPYSERVQPICLPRRYEDRPDAMAWIAGWGQTGTDTEIHESGLEGLEGPILHVAVLGDDYSRPRQLYEGRMRIRDFSDGCEISTDAVNITSRFHICQRSAPSSIGVGDSGGPLMVQLATGGVQRWYEIGVETWRTVDEKEPSYAERVSPYCEWISEVSGGEAQCVD